jgi:Ca-activated chloride channel homolog
MRFFRVYFIFTACASVIGVAQQPFSPDGPVLSPRLSKGARPSGSAPSLRVDVSRVMVPVIVTDSDDHVVEGLSKQDFRVLEDGVPQEVTEFFVNDSPVSVGIVLDSSNSMRTKFDAARQAVGAFLRRGLLGDRFFLIAVHDRPELVHAFTSNVEELEHDMKPMLPYGWTSLYDGMFLGVDHLKRSADLRRVLLVLSDGGDNNSRYTESEIKNLVMESDVRVFTISILERSPAVEKLAERSGGRAFRVHKIEELVDKAAELSSLVHHEYVLGFKPTSQNRDGKYHTVKVELTQPTDRTRFHTSWRHGYYAPVQ